MWGESDVIWTQGVIELFRWRRQRRVLTGQAALLVRETERFLTEVHEVRPPTDPPRSSEPPRHG